MGKEKGYLLYEEVNDLLPSDLGSSDELDDIFSMFGSMGIEVVDSEQKFREKSEEEGVELDLTPGRSTRRTTPCACTCARWGTVPLLTREGEVEIAKRIERGKNAMLRAISRTNMAAQEVLRLGERLGAREIGSATPSSSTRRRSPRRSSRPRSRRPSASSARRTRPTRTTSPTAGTSRSWRGSRAAT